MSQARVFAHVFDFWEMPGLSASDRALSLGGSLCFTLMDQNGNVHPKFPDILYTGNAKPVFMRS